MTLSNTRHQLPDRDILERVQSLLERYPETSEAETLEIGAFLKQATPLEVGLLSGNAAAWTKSEQYKIDHAHLFAMSKLELAIWLGLAALVVSLTAFLLWDVGVI
jgi:hypothetical protein